MKTENIGDGWKTYTKSTNGRNPGPPTVRVTHREAYMSKKAAEKIGLKPGQYAPMAYNEARGLLAIVPSNPDDGWKIGVSNRLGCPLLADLFEPGESHSLPLVAMEIDGEAAYGVHLPAE